MDKGALTRATDSSTAPTPGYLYNDISKSLTSPQACVETLNYLINRSGKNNPHIKKKCLKVLGKVSAHAASRGMMKRAVVQNPAAISAIKEAINYRGSMDAVTGDQYNLEVRDAAKECLEVVYSDAGDVSQQMGGAGGGGMGGQLQGGGMAGLGGGGSMGGSGGGGYGGQGGGGYGGAMGGAPGSGFSPTNASGMGSSGGGGSRMEGIGNPMFSDPRMAQNQAAGGKLGQLGEMASNVGGAMLEMMKDPLARDAKQVAGGNVGGMSGYGGPNARPDPYSQPPGRNNLAMQTGGQWTMASNRGANAVGGSCMGGVGSASNMVPTPAPTSAAENSEYYKARNSQGGPSFSWAASGGGAPATAVAAAPAAPSHVGGSWASAPMAPAPAAMGTPQMSVAARSRAQAHGHANVASAVPVGRSGGYGGPGSNSFGAGGGGGDYEKNLIAELCPPGGMKAEPPEEKLEEFARAIPSLNPDLVCPALLDAVEEGNPWIMRAKALCVIETVLKVESESGGEVQAYTDFFHACVGEIEPLSNHARASVKGPAKRVLAALGVNGGSMAVNVVSARASAPVAAPAAPPTNLLDFDEPTPAVTVPVANTGPAVPPASVGGDSLFSGLNTKASAPVASPPTVPSVQQQHDDLLGGMGGPSPTEVSAVPAAPAPAASGDLFGNMTVKAASTGLANVETVPEPPASAAPPASGSAFGFMNNTPASPVPPPPAQVTPAVASPKSFDPLLSMGMSGNAGPTVSPGAANPNMAQMQQMQMAYQQNMMMMQQQMQQMQMGYGASPGNNNNFQQQQHLGATFPSGVPPMPGTMPSKQPIMTANYMRQVPGVSGDKMSSFSFLGSDPKKQEIKSFDFIQDAMKNEKK